MEEGSSMDTIPHIEETPLTLMNKLATKSPFLSSIFQGDLRKSFKREGFLGFS